jgi:hypothetical protein
MAITRAKAAAHAAGPVIVYPRGVEIRYQISAPTRWRWERDSRLPKRDVFLGSKAIGWRPTTLENAERGPTPAAPDATVAA